MDIDIKASRAIIKGQQRGEVLVTLEDVILEELIEDVGVSNLLDAIGDGATIEYFGFKIEE